MTREEAMAILEVSKHMATSGRMYNQAIDMAIEALKAEPTDTDLISRADAIDCCECHGSQECKDRIKALPSAEQVISKLNNACDSLLTDESNGSKEHKSKLDLISRQDVIEALCRSSVYAWSIEQDQTAHNWALNIIKALPSADAVQGVWEHIESKWADNIFKCSKCGNPLIIPTFDGEPIYNYCVHCGAKMGNAWGERND